MLLFHKPSEEEVQTFLRSLQIAPLSYAMAGCTRDGAAAGFHRDQQRVLLGHGEETFRRACEAIRSWQMLPPSVVEVSPRESPTTAGTLVAILFRARLLGGWLVLPTRIVYAVDDVATNEHAEIVRFGFAYGTVQGHWEQGEEQFLIEWDRRDDSVWYDLLAISRPRHPLAWLSYPYVRWQQARFRRQSAEAMKGAVTGKAIGTEFLVY